MLVSETHFTNKNYIRIPNYSIYTTNHPNNKAHGGTAIIIKTSIKHHEIDKYHKEFLQATSIMIEDWSGPLVISAIYSPPKYAISQQLYTEFFESLGHRFIAGGDAIIAIMPNIPGGVQGLLLPTLRGVSCMKLYYLII